MPDYRVCWEIDVEAADATMAARLAQIIQRDVLSIANVFTVQDRSARFDPELVDLNALK